MFNWLWRCIITIRWWWTWTSNSVWCGLLNFAFCPIISSRAHTLLMWIESNNIWCDRGERRDQIGYSSISSVFVFFVSCSNPNPSRVYFFKQVNFERFDQREQWCQVDQLHQESISNASPVFSYLMEEDVRQWLARMDNFCKMRTSVIKDGSISNVLLGSCSTIVEHWRHTRSESGRYWTDMGFIGKNAANDVAVSIPKNEWGYS